MNRPRQRGLTLGAILGGAACIAASSGNVGAREWTPTPEALAYDYLLITDQRPDNQIVIVYWVASPLYPKGQQRDKAAQVLDKSIVLGVTRYGMEPDGSIKFYDQSPPTVSIEAGGDLAPMGQEARSPAEISLIAGLEVGITRALGQIGGAIKWNAFEAGPLRPCSPGGMRVRYSGEVYTFTTPIPGCDN